MDPTSTIGLMNAFLMSVGIPTLRSHELTDTRVLLIWQLANLVFFAFVIVSMTIHMLIECDDTAVLVETLNQFLTFIIGAGKINLIFYNRKELKEMVDAFVFGEYSARMRIVRAVQLDEMMSGAASEELKHAMSSSKCRLYSVLGVFVRVFAFNCYGTSAIYFIKPFILAILYPDIGYTLFPLQLWLPFDHTITSIYICKYIIHSVAAAVICSSYVGPDVLFALLTGHIGRELKIVDFILNNLDELASETAQYASPQWERNSNVVLADCTKQYVQIKSACSRLNAMYAPFFVIQALCTSTMMSSCLFMIATAKSLMSMGSIGSMMHYGAGVVQLLVYCTACQQLADGSARLHWAASGSWWTHNRRYRTSTLLLCTGLLQPIDIRILGSTNLDFEFFTKVAKTAFSILTLLLTVTGNK